MRYIEERVGVLEAKVASLEARRVRLGAVGPTWTNSNGETFRLLDMPTPYLKNIRRFAARMSAITPNGGANGTGLVDAIDNELAVRND